MIGYLRGRILEHAEGRMIVVVTTGSASLSDSEQGGVGYSVAVPQSPSYLGLLPGKWAELYVHTHVREDALDLHGFATLMEKELFLALLGVNGIGPKVALAILSASEPSELVQAI